MVISKISRICTPVIFFLFFIGCCGQQENSISRNIHFSSPQPDLIKAMTFNIRVDTFIDAWNRWNNRKDIAIDTIRDNAPDVLGLQEALDHQVRDIHRTLPQYAVYSAGRNDGRKKGESCAIFYRKDRFELVDRGTFWFSNTPDKPGSRDWGNFPPRICSWVYLVEKLTHSGFYVYNVHLDNLSQNSRKKSVRLLAKKVAARKTDDPFIVMGDFNMELDNPAMKYLCKIGCKTPYPKMVDAWNSVHPGQTHAATRHNFRGGTGGPKIDHIPISENVRALDVKIDQRKVNGHYPSDHYPVIAEILLKNPVQTSQKQSICKIPRRDTDIN